jgi:hypothetical protein
MAEAHIIDAVRTARGHRKIIQARLARIMRGMILAEVTA